MKANSENLFLDRINKIFRIDKLGSLIHFIHEFIQIYTKKISGHS
jgi:hypothetical protein